MHQGVYFKTVSLHVLKLWTFFSTVFLFQMMAEMYQKCNLIHADLSEYNMLWHENNVYFIDVSQSVEPMHPHALEFLYRDCKNVTSFFEKFGVEVISAENLFNQVSKLDIPVEQDEDFMSEVKIIPFFLFASF